MKMKQVHAPLVMAVISALVNVASSATPGPHGLNLNGKMFTLSSYSGGISFYPPSWPHTPSYTTERPYPTTERSYPTTKRPYTTKHPYPTTMHYPTASKHPYTTTERPYPTTERPYPTTKRPYPTTMHYPTASKHPYTTTERPYPTSTAPFTRGVSVCLRYLTDYAQLRYPTIFTLSRSRNPLQLSGNGLGDYTLACNSYGYNRLTLKPSIRFWSNIGPDIWSRVCLTLDSMKNVAQVFSGSNISIRKVMPYQFVWSGEPVIDFTGFDGQVTDVQVWDYPLSYREVFNYMTSGVHGPYQGSVLTWSSISYSPRGDALLEDVYEWQAKQQISGRRGRRPKGEKKPREFVNVDKREEGKGNQL